LRRQSGIDFASEHAVAEPSPEQISPGRLTPPLLGVELALRFGYLAYHLSLDLRERGIVVPRGTWRSNCLGIRRRETPTRGVFGFVVLVDLAVRTLDTRHDRSSVALKAILDARASLGTEDATGTAPRCGASEA